MSLATRCTACGTIFRVVQDQLKVSDGWVRCGRCQQVFNATQSLFDLEQDAPPPWPPAPVPGNDWERTNPSGRSATTNASPAAEPDDAPDTVAEQGFERTAAPPAEDSPFSTQPLLRARSREETAQASASENDVELEGRADFADARFNPELLDPEEGGTVSPTSVVSAMRSPAAAETVDASAAHVSAPVPVPVPGRSTGVALPRLVDEPPRFVREAERAERWRSPAVRTALLSSAVVLALLLMLQLALHFRAATAAAWPALAPLLQQVCGWAVCGPEAPRNLEQLTVTSTALVKGSTPGDFTLQVTLANQAGTPVMLPAVELSLTDGQGRLVARRALLPEELSATQRSVPAHGELTLNTALSLGATRVVGYSVEIFYP